MNDFPRSIELAVDVPAPAAEVWKAWTTRDGIRTFFAPDGKIDARPDGPYEIYFDPSASPGQRGADEMRVLAVQPEHMLSFTWNAPPSLPEVRRQRTHVTIRLESIDENHTRVRLSHDGWGDGGEWDQAFDYFTRAWGRVVLPFLKYRFEHGPIDWKRPPKLENL